MLRARFPCSDLHHTLDKVGNFQTKVNVGLSNRNMSEATGRVHTYAWWTTTSPSCNPCRPRGGSKGITGWSTLLKAVNLLNLQRHEWKLVHDILTMLIQGSHRAREDEIEKEMTDLPVSMP